jgi:integrase
MHGYSIGYSEGMMRGKGEGSVYQRGDGLWCVAVELPPGDDGKRRRKVICRKSKPKVLEALRDLNHELAEHGDIITGSITLGDWLDYWLVEIMTKERRNEPGTIANKRGHIEKWIKPVLGNKPLTKLTPAHIRRLHGHILDESGSVGLVRQVHITLKKAMSDAVRDQKIRHAQNPMERMDTPAEAPRKARKALTTAESIRLLAHLATREDRALWATVVLTGARRGEIIGLETDRVGEYLDLSWQLARISNIDDAPKGHEHRHIAGNLYFKRPKSKTSWRIIPLVEPLRSILALHMEGREPGLVFTEPDGSPIHPDAATRRWNDLLEEAGLPKDVVLHGARHTTVDLLLAAGVPPHVVQEIVGHATLQQTLEYKTRRNLPELEAAMHSMSELLGASSK